MGRIFQQNRYQNEDKKCEDRNHVLSYSPWTIETHKKYKQMLKIKENSNISWFEPKFVPQDPFNMFNFWTKFCSNQRTFAYQIGSQAQLVTLGVTP